MLTEFDFLGPEKTPPGKSSKLSSKKKKSKYPLTSTQINDSLLDDEGNPFEEANTRGTKKATARISLEEKVFQRQLEEAMELSRTAEASTMNSTLPLSNEASGSPLEVMEINPSEARQLPSRKEVSAAPVDDDFTVSISNKENKIRISRTSKKKLIMIDDDSDDDFPEGPVNLKSFKKHDKIAAKAAEKPPQSVLTESIQCENGSAKRKREDISYSKSEKNSNSKIKTEKKSSNPDDGVDNLNKEKLHSSPEKSKNNQLNKCESKSKQSEDDSVKVKSKRPKYNFCDDDYSEEDPQEEPESEEEYSPIKSSKKSSKKDKKKASDKSPKESKSKKKSSDKSLKESKSKKEVLKTDSTSLQSKSHTEIKSKSISDPPRSESNNLNLKSPVVSPPKKAVSTPKSCGSQLQTCSKPKPVSTTPKITPRPITPKIIPKWTPPARIGQNNGSSNKTEQKASPIVGIRVGLSRKFKASKPLHSNVKFTP